MNSGVRRRRKGFLICGVIGSLVCAILGGLVLTYILHEKQEHDYMYSVVTSNEAKKLIENELRYVDSAALTSDGEIKSYRIDMDTIEHNPMGGIMVDIILNNDPEMDMSVIFEKDNPEEKLELNLMSMSEKMDKLYQRKEVSGESLSNE
ncbi:DUF1310 family protein [Alloscardovia theropitheci]|uniref:DUF1310 family protein n=1 Tax=Alloscardovia theropitheci TaxID=2496842 RepID=A0A4R0QXQ4_9BIFI|nr:DUF1310 family protein [Alloscardovia theropitheci]TCD54261.1 DUF1310 family protein [Alloscardovia theropitheci]